MSFNLLPKYLEKHKESLHTGAVAYYAALDQISETSESTAKSIIQELYDQNNHIKLIASENFCSLATQLAQGNLLTDKYAEGFARHRFYAGCDNVDDIEAEACELACKLFGADHAFVQPHAGADANMIAFSAILNQKVRDPLVEKLGYKKLTDIPDKEWTKIREAMNSQKLLAMDYYSGGHLTHGYRYNISAQMFDVCNYTVNKETNELDVEELRKSIHEVKPLIFLVGYSAYTRKINFKKLRELADEVGAVFMVDMAHFAGLVAGKVFTGEYDPIPYAHVVTTTTHKTLRGPRGAMVLCKEEFGDMMDKSCPTILGGPLPHAMAAKVVAFKEALKPEFQTYAAKVVENSRALGEACVKRGMTLSTGGTDNHQILVNVDVSYGINGKQAEAALRECGITLNRNALPFDTNGPWYTSGLRLGTPATTTLGMGLSEMDKIADIIHSVLSNTKPLVVDGKAKKAKYVLDEAIVKEAKAKAEAILKEYPLYPELDHELIFSVLN